MLRQRLRCLRLRLGLWLSLRLALGRGRRRWGLGDDRSAGPGLRHGLRCRDRLDSLSGCNRDAARDHCGSRDAEACARDEVAAGDNRSSVLFSDFWVAG
jgi:hypothetical protein